MEDPVGCPDGYSYDKEELTAWLRIKRTSLLTQQPVPAQPRAAQRLAFSPSNTGWRLCNRLDLLGLLFLA